MKITVSQGYMTARAYLKKVRFGKMTRKEVRWFKSRLRLASKDADRQYVREGRVRVRMYPYRVFEDALKPIAEARAAAQKEVQA